MIEVDLGPLDVALVPVIDRERHRHADGPGRRALQAERPVVLEGIRLGEQINVGKTVRLGEPDIGVCPVDAEPKRDTDATNEAISLQSVMLQVANTLASSSSTPAATIRLR